MATEPSDTMALDLMLKTLVLSPEFAELQDKNWAQIARTIPGTTQRQCQRRYEELLKEIAPPSHNSITSILGGKPRSGPGSTQQSPSITPTRASKSEPETHETTRPVSAYRPGSAKAFKGSKSEKETTAGKASETNASGDQGPVMVIHVCDEAKKLKQDFQCPRDLLIREMRYFAEYLSTDAQRWEEVDISVHCDVLIFEWLMKYVKRDCSSAKAVSSLEPTNVISILISSDFLKMETLVEECITYCHQNLSAIVATPCNMNCIHDGLVTRIADRFTHNTADAVKDRKDKFKSKLFAKKLERMFDANTINLDSPENASTMYRCSVCKKVLTKTLDSKLKCAQSRLMIDRSGQLCYQHVRDPQWDCNDYLLELKQQLKMWRDVYWRVWGLCNWLTCTRCGEVFQCTDLGHCQYHADAAVFDNGPIGEFPCCNLKALRFDPAQPNKYHTGCKVRDHVVELPAEDQGDKQLAEKRRVYADMLAHRDAITVPYQRLQAMTEEDSKISIFSQEEAQCGLLVDLVRSPSASDSNTANEDSKPRLQALTTTQSRELSTYADDEFTISDESNEFGDDEDETYRSRPGGKVRSRRSRLQVTTVDPQAILMDGPDFGTTSTRKWDSSRSLRWNQDAQREEDQRRINEIILYLTKLRCNTEKMDKLKQKEYSGGLFSKLEAQWKATAMATGKTAAQYRNKPRLGTISK